MFVVGGKQLPGTVGGGTATKIMWGKQYWKVLGLKRKQLVTVGALGYNSFPSWLKGILDEVIWSAFRATLLNALIQVVLSPQTFYRVLS